MPKTQIPCLLLVLTASASAAVFDFSLTGSSSGNNSQGGGSGNVQVDDATVAIITPAIDGIQLTLEALSGSGTPTIGANSQGVGVSTDGESDANNTRIEGDKTEAFRISFDKAVSLDSMRFGNFTNTEVVTLTFISGSNPFTSGTSLTINADGNQGPADDILLASDAIVTGGIGVIQAGTVIEMTVSADCLLNEFTVSPALPTAIVGSVPAPVITENPNPGPNLGSTVIADGNLKGQSFSVATETTIESFVFECDGVTTPGNFSVELYHAMDDVPWLLNPIATGIASLPAGLADGDLFEIELLDPVVVERGSYVVTLGGVGATEFAIPISNDPLYPTGGGVRNNSAEGWRPLINADSDLVFAVTGTQAADPFPAAPAGAPNIVFILADDLGWTDLNIGGNGPNVLGGTDYGSGYYETPNLAQLAAEGLSFTHCYAQPNCAPTRAAILSGQYACRDGNGVYHVDGLNRGRNSPNFGSAPQFTGPSQNEDIPASHLISAEVLQAGGYVTAHVGKYHVGNHEGGSATLPENQGFDFNFGGKQNGNPGNYFSNNESFNGALGDGLQSYAKNYTSGYITDNLVSVANGNDPTTLLPSTPDKFVQDGIGDAAVAFLRDHAKGNLSARPFYLQVHSYAVHTPIGNSQSRPDLLSKFQAITSTDPRHGSAPYAAILENLDQSVGRILAFLDDSGLASNTIVVFTSDNGGHIGPTDNDPVRFRKGSFYEGGLRVPLIVRWPDGGIPAGEQTDALVHSVDFFPTFVDAAQLSMPTQNAIGDPVNYDGASFLSHAADPDTVPDARDTVFYHFPGYLDERARPCEVAVKKIDGKDYKLIYTYDTGYVGNSNPNGSDEDGTEGLDVLTDNWELYCLTDDLSETTDLLDGSSYSNWLLYGEIAEGMAQDIVNWLGQTDSDWAPSQITDGGTPVPFLSASTLPAVSVPFEQTFRITSSVPNLGTDEISLTWNSESGFSYDIEVSDGLTGWSTLATGIAATGTSTSATVPDPDIATSDRRFYRVVLTP
ncbi:hypothetical protein HAHE_08550 [Haloferula helveola]|uniref:Sulfatase N-terminal domain-containing protein n=1 Tax=Haloferula helveola TaxID=490095 RepID=A0ABN6H087_9BACT|nr:hypothetical protein HAHE_08550 [Haloferula helveola]